MICIAMLLRLEGVGLVKKNIIITVDGPAGAGKSTISKLLAEALSYVYLDTGALYRAIAYQIDKEGLSGEESEKIPDLCKRTRLILKSRGGDVRVCIGDRDVTEDIRTPKISMLASRISAFPVVRKHLLTLQREIGRHGAIVAEGRDMGTVVFPKADIKFFLDASVEERTRRRYAELRGRGFAADFENVKSEIEQRDRQDREREIAPLMAAKDAIIIDSTNDGVTNVVNRMMSMIRSRFQDDF